MLAVTGAALGASGIIAMWIRFRREDAEKQRAAVRKYVNEFNARVQRMNTEIEKAIREAGKEPWQE
jgi:hypothetical protein